MVNTKWVQVGLRARNMCALGSAFLALLLAGCGGSSQDPVVEEETVVNLPAYPVPNGYDTLRQAAENVAPAPGVVAELGRAVLLSHVGQHRELLEVVTTALDQESRVILDGASEFEPDREVLRNQWGHLADLLLMAGRYEELTVQTRKALEYYLMAFQLGRAIGKGGMLEDRLSSIQIEQSGVAAVLSIRHKLSKENLAIAFEQLVALQSSLESAVAIQEWEALLAQTVHAETRSGWDASRQTAHQDAILAYSEALGRHADVLNRALLRLALQTYEYQKGKIPTALDQLVPDILEAVPVQSATGQPFVLADLEDPETSAAP